jgi:lipoate-protein ligase B
MISETVVSEFHTKQVTVGTTAARLEQAGRPKLHRGVWVKALSTNTGIVYVGEDDKVASIGYELLKGESVHVPVDALEKVWAAADAADQKVSLLFA